MIDFGGSGDKPTCCAGPIYGCIICSVATADFRLGRLECLVEEAHDGPEVILPVVEKRAYNRDIIEMNKTNDESSLSESINDNDIGTDVVRPHARSIRRSPLF